MAPKTYSQLKKGKEDCIYRAFENITRETKEQMGARINQAGYDADDSQGVVALADAYGLDVFEAFFAADYQSGNYGLEKNRDYILICTRDLKARNLVRAWDHSDGILKTSEARNLLMDKAYDSLNWHAIYAWTSGTGSAVFKDPQGLFPTGPNSPSVAVAICASGGG